MQMDLFLWISYVFVLVVVVDISINLRRLINNLDRVWRKLAEINDSIRKQ